MRGSSLGVDDIDRMIGRIYESSVDPGAIPEILETIANRFNAHSALFFTPKLAAQNGGLSHILNVDPNAFEQYLNHYFDVDLWWQGACAMAVEGETGIVVGNELIDRRSFDRSEFYNDYLSKIDTYHVIANNTRVKTHAGPVDLSIAFHGSPRHEGFGREHKRLLSRLLPHLRRAVYLASELSGPMRNTALTTDVLEDLAFGAIVLAANCKVLHCNSVAERLLNDNRGISIRHGHLCASLAQHNRELQSHLLRASGRTGPPEGGTTVVRSPRTGTATIINILPIPDRRPMVALHPAKMLVIIRNPASKRAPHWSLFSRHYGLTSAELRLCQALAAGNTVGEYCRSTGISDNTARTHLKHVFSKTGVRRQTELVALINAFG